MSILTTMCCCCCWCWCCCCCCCCWYKQRLGPLEQGIRAYFGICFVILKGVLGVWHRFKKEFWCRLLALFFTSVKASWAPFCTFLASKSGKKGSSRFALYQCDFSGCWTPFWGSCSPNLAKRGPAACSFGVPYFSFSFSSRWSPFWGSCSPNFAKRGPAACSFGVP